MDRFSELVAKGVAAFNYTPIASDSVSCPVCRSYNNIFSIATDTHMDCYGENGKIITGSLVGNYKMFDFFQWTSQFRGVNFTHSGVTSFADWMSKCGFQGHYEMVNHQPAYILTPIEEQPEDNESNVASYVTSESRIPQSSRFLSKNSDYEDIAECIGSNPYETAKKLNESKYVYGKNWTVANLSEGTRIVGLINGKNYMLQS